MIYYIDIVDKRNQVLFELLKQENKEVEVFNLQENNYKKGDTLIFAPSLKFDETFLKKLPDDIVLFAGNFNPILKTIAREKNIEYHNIMEDEVFTVKNANLTCEGVLALMIEHSPYSLYENNVLILGNGRIAKGMSIMLDKLGVNYSLASFTKENFSQNYLYSKSNYFAFDFVRDLNKFDIIINTIPAQILDEKVISHIAPNTIFIETASVNCLDINKVNNFKYILAPALPQKYSHKTAGKLMLDCVMQRNF